MFSFFKSKQSTSCRRQATQQRSAAAVRGRFNAERLPAGAAELGLPAGAGGLFIGFVPPYANFQGVAEGLKRAAWAVGRQLCGACRRPAPSAAAAPRPIAAPPVA